MASTEALAAAFRIKPKSLKMWLDGIEPSSEKDVAIYQEIREQEEYKNGEWYPKQKEDNIFTPPAAPQEENSSLIETTLNKPALPAEPQIRESEPFGAKALEDFEASSSEQKEALFQAVGVITGKVQFTDDGKCTVTIGSKQYQLFYATPHRIAFELSQVTNESLNVSPR